MRPSKPAGALRGRPKKRQELPKRRQGSPQRPLEAIWERFCSVLGPPWDLQNPFEKNIENSGFLDFHEFAGKLQKETQKATKRAPPQKPTWTPGAPQERPRRLQEPPGAVQEDPGAAQEATRGPEEPPGALQEGPQRRQEPRGAQRGQASPKAAPRGAKRPPEAILERFWSVLGSPGTSITL